MSVKEKPSFFNCRCGTHYKVEITDAMRRKAKQLGKNTNEVDTTDSRSSSRSQQDSYVGKLAEVAVFEFFDSQNIPVSFNDGWRYDMDVNGRRAEIKARDYSQTASRYCDLLVRDRKDTQWSPDDVDIVIQVMVDGSNSTAAYITGYVTGKYAAQCDLFRKAKTYRTRKVEHSQLRPIEELF